MTDNTDKLGGDGMDARAYEALEKEFQEVRHALYNFHIISLMLAS